MIYQPDISQKDDTALSVIALLFAGLLRLLKLPFESRAEFLDYRERACRVRSALYHVELRADTLRGNAEVLASWSGNDTYWFRRVQALWLAGYNLRPAIRALVCKSAWSWLSLPVQGAQGGIDMAATRAPPRMPCTPPDFNAAGLTRAEGFRLRGVRIMPHASLNMPLAPLPAIAYMTRVRRGNLIGTHENGGTDRPLSKTPNIFDRSGLAGPDRRIQPVGRKLFLETT